MCGAALPPSGINPGFPGFFFAVRDFFCVRDFRDFFNKNRDFLLKTGIFAKNRDFLLKRDFQRFWLIVYFFFLYSITNILCFC